MSGRGVRVVALAALMFLSALVVGWPGDLVPIAVLATVLARQFSPAKSSSQGRDSTSGSHGS